MKKLSLFTVSLIIASISAHAQNQMPPIKDLPVVKKELVKKAVAKKEVVKKEVVTKEAPANYNGANKAIKPNQAISNNKIKQNIKPATANKINNNEAKLPQIAKQVDKRKIKKQAVNPNDLKIDSAAINSEKTNSALTQNKGSKNKNYGSKKSELKARVKKRLQMMRNLTTEQRNAVKQARKEYLEKVKKITNNQIAN